MEYGFITYRAGTHICMQGDPANTVGAQRSQDQINELTSLFDARDCWGGQIAMAPGATVQNLLGSQDYARRLQRMSCDVNFRVDGDWSSWNSWSACQSGTINSTRSRTCNNPFPATGGADCTGSSTEQIACPPADVVVPSSSAAGASSSANAASSSTATTPTYEGATTGIVEDDSINPSFAINASFGSTVSIYLALPMLALSLFSF